MISIYWLHLAYHQTNKDHDNVASNQRLQVTIFSFNRWHFKTDQDLNQNQTSSNDIYA
jgi:hypothetical protein